MRRAESVPPMDLTAALEVFRQEVARQQSEGPTVGELWADYWRLECRHLPTQATEEARWRLHLAPYFQHRKAAGLTLLDVAEYREMRRVDQPKRGNKPTRPATRNKELTRLRRMLSWAVECGTLSRHPWTGYSPEPEDNVRRSCPVDCDVERILAECSPTLAAYVLTAFDSGMRQSEVRLLRRDEVDFKAGLIRLAAERTKTRQARVVPLSERVADALSRLPLVIGSPYFFVNPETGKPWNRIYLYKCYREAVARAGVAGGAGERLVFHDLRRGFSTKGRKSGVAESVMMRITGHTTLLTFQRYNIIDDTDIHLAAAKIFHPQK